MSSCLPQVMRKFVAEMQQGRRSGQVLRNELRSRASSENLYNL